MIGGLFEGCLRDGLRGGLDADEHAEDGRWLARVREVNSWVEWDDDRGNIEI